MHIISKISPRKVYAKVIEITKLSSGKQIERTNQNNPINWAIIVFRIVVNTQIQTNHSSVEQQLLSFTSSNHISNSQIEISVPASPIANHVEGILDKQGLGLVVIKMHSVLVDGYQKAVGQTQVRILRNLKVIKISRI